MTGASDPATLTLVAQAFGPDAYARRWDMERDVGKPSKIDRREMLKRAAVAGGVAWAAPVLTSLRTPAFAQYPPNGPCGCNGGEPRTCQGTVVIDCPDTPTPFTCFCWTRVEGGTVCGTFAATTTCNSDAECGTGEACVVCSGDFCPCASTGRACTPICEGCVARTTREAGTLSPPTA